MIDVRKYNVEPLLVLEKQEPKESRTLWAKLTEGIKTNQLDMATEEKTRVEDEERALRKKREEEHIEWKPRFFDVHGEDYTLKGVET